MCNPRADCRLALTIGALRGASVRHPDLAAHDAKRPSRIHRFAVSIESSNSTIHAASRVLQDEYGDAPAGRGPNARLGRST